MSKPGDVVWADGVAWQRDTDKNWYSTDRYEPLFKKDLKEFPDFTWLVKDGEVRPNYDDAVKEYEQLLDDVEKEQGILTKARDAAQKRLEETLDFVNETHEQLLKARVECQIAGVIKECNELRIKCQNQEQNTGSYQDEKEKCCADTNCYEVEVLRDELTSVTTNRDILLKERDYWRCAADSASQSRDEFAALFSAEVKQRDSAHGRGRKDERAAIVAWLRAVYLPHMAECIEHSDQHRDAAENRFEWLDAQLSRAALVERAAIVAWLRGEHDNDHLAACLAGAAADIEFGKHMAGDDE